jgi:hypothetical protein
MKTIVRVFATVELPPHVPADEVDVPLDDAGEPDELGP